MIDVKHVTMEDKKLTGILQALQDDSITVDEAKAKLCDLHNVSVSPVQKELDSRRGQIKDINQWSHMGLSRHDLTLRVIRSLFCDINNRTTD